MDGLFDYAGILCPLLIFVALILIGLFVGGTVERAHFRRLDRREQEQADCLITQIKSFPHADLKDPPPRMIVAEVVIASDYLKSFLAGLRNFFGGRVGSYQTMLERARREAIMRVVEEARRLGYNAVCNIRLQTADVGGSTTSQRVAMAAILASGTAYHAGSTKQGE